MSVSQPRNIALVGASGNVGRHILTALLSRGIHTITILTRADSSSVLPAGVKVEKGSYTDDAFLASALKGQDVLVLALGIPHREMQVPLIKAAAEARVKWVVPTEYGTDIPDEMVRDHPVLGGQGPYRKLIQKEGMEYLAIVNNPWLDWGLGKGLWGLDIKNKKATLYDGGEKPFHTTTIAGTGAGVAALLTLSDEELAKHGNQVVYLSSFRVSQRDLLASVIRVTGDKEGSWQLESKDGAAAVKLAKDAEMNGDMMAGLLGHMVSHTQDFYGRGHDYHTRVTSMAQLGAEEEDLDKVVKKIVQQVQTKSRR